MSTPDKTAKKLFISYSTEDADLANRLVAELEQQGMSCWIAPRNISAGHAYGAEIIKAIEACDGLVLVLSKRSNASRHVASEVSRAFSRGKLILPFRAERVEPSEALELFVSSSQWIDGWSGHLSERAREIGVTLGATGDDTRPARAASKRDSSSRRVPVAALVSIALIGAALILGGYRLLSMRKGSSAGHEFRLPAEHRGATPAAEVALPNYKALVIGIDQYATRGAAGWQPLRTAKADADAVADLLQDYYGFQVERLLDEDATRGAVMEALDRYSSGGANDAVLIYFAGHGFYDARLGEGYWVPADARRKIDGRDAREDWLWNSTMTQIFSAATVRHLLVLADSCYSGALFRGDQPLSEDAGDGWYAEALGRPSRFLIASGGIEPVLDGSADHSVFAQQVLNSLKHSSSDLIAASDLGTAVRQRVAELSGQMVQMGPLPVSGHAGGEFVFVKPTARDRFPKITDAAAPQVEIRGPAEDVEAGEEGLRKALSLASGGAPRAARRMADAIALQRPDDRLAASVAEYLDSARQQEKRTELQTLIDRLAQRKLAAGESGGAIGPRPRVVACIGPSVSGDVEAPGSLSLLYRIALISELQAAGVTVVEREALEEVLAEMDLGSSDLSDPRARLAIGKLLPAGVLLFGDLLPSEEKGDRLLLRAVDTETTRMLATFSETREPDAEVEEISAAVANKLVAKLREVYPLAGWVTSRNAKKLKVAFGAFHGVTVGQTFDVVYKDANGQEVSAGSASAESVTDDFTVLEASWTTEPPANAGIFVREQG